MEYKSSLKDITVEPLQPFGVMLINQGGLRRLPDLPAALVRELLWLHKLVILRGFEAIEKAELVDYAKSYGHLLEWDFGNVMEMRVHEAPKNYLFTEGQVPYHWDGAFHQEPRFLLFNCIVAPDKSQGGETFFANTEAFLNDLTAMELDVFRQYRLCYETEKVVHYGGKISVPLIQEHPFLNHNIMRFAEPVSQGLNPVTVHVEGVKATDSDALIAKLAAAFHEPRYRYSHAWETNDFLLADNFSLLHGRNAFNQFSARHLRRIQIL